MRVALLCFNTFNRSSYHGVEPDLLGQANAAADAGFGGFGPDVFSLEAHVAAAGSLADLRALLAARDLAVPEIAALSVSGDGAATEADAARLAPFVEELGAPWVLTNVYESPSAGVVDAFRRAAARVRDAGGRLALEFMPISAITSISEAVEFLDRTGVPDAAVLVDSWHVFRGPTTWADVEALPLERIAYVQFDDALPVVGEDLVHETIERRVMPGDGEFDLHRFCRALRSKGFDGTVSVEVLNGEMRGSMDVGEFARRAYRASAPYWA
jgi:sugar phosphate isomerase/epimerase